MLLRTFSLFLILVLSAGAGCSERNDASDAVEPLTLSSEGAVEPSCSPVDAAAIQMVLDTNDNRQVAVRLNKSLAESKGFWALGNQDESGGLAISLCNRERTQCEQADDGELVVERVTDDEIEGQLSFTFGPFNRTAHRFVLKVTTTEQPRCG